MKKQKGNRMFPVFVAASILLLVGIYVGLSNLVSADKDETSEEEMEMGDMMKSMSLMMNDMKEMHEQCEKMHGENMDMGKMMQGMMGSSQSISGMTQEEHESHHR